MYSVASSAAAAARRTLFCFSRDNHEPYQSNSTHMITIVMGNFGGSTTVPVDWFHYGDQSIVLISRVNAITLEPLVRFWWSFVCRTISAWPRIEKVLVTVDWILFKWRPFKNFYFHFLHVMAISFKTLVWLASNLVLTLIKTFLSACLAVVMVQWFFKIGHTSLIMHPRMHPMNLLNLIPHTWSP